MRIGIRFLAAAACIAAIACLPVIAKKKRPDDVTQTLALPKDPPAAVNADPHRLVFRVVPLSNKGLLSQQTREAVKALLKLAPNETMVRLRAFVAGSGDLRRVPQIVSETFTERKLALPAVSVVQTGGLPLAGAQVLLEAISLARKSEINPNGVLFLSGQRAGTVEAADAVAPLARQALEQFDMALKKGGGSSVLRVTCFVSSLADAGAVSAMLAAKYPGAAAAVVQTRRAAATSAVECEGVAKLAQPVNSALMLRDGDRVIAAAVSAPAIALTGTQVAYGYEDRNARVAFDRMNRILEPVRASWKSVVEVRFYPVAGSIARQIERIRVDFLDPANPPAMSMIPIEGLPSIDASFAMDAIAVAH
jgi:enamine deaminase RidA (YjgF/YER057c/UK114 family)